MLRYLIKALRLDSIVLGMAFVAIGGCASGSLAPKSAPVFVEASGVGANRQSALNEAFKDAIQRSVGILVDSKSTLTNNKLVYDSLNEYSSGFIEQYEIVKEQRAGDGLVKIDITAVVSSTKLVERFLSSKAGANASTTANQNLYAQLKTVIDSRNSGDLLLARLLSEYPKGAFELTLSKMSASIDSQRNVFIRVPYQIKWSKTYLQALKETVQSIAKKRCWLAADGDPKCRSDIKFSTGFWGFDEFVSYQMEDLRQAGLLAQYLRPVIGIQFSFYGDNQKYLFSACENVPLDTNEYDVVRSYQSMYPIIKRNYGGGVDIFDRKRTGVLEREILYTDFIANIRTIEAVAVKFCR